MEKAATPEAKAEAKSKFNESLGKLTAAQTAAAAAGPIDPKAHAGIKEDLFKTKETLQKEREAKAALEQKIADAEKAKLVEQQNFKKLWEESEQKTASEKKRSDAVVASYVRDKKIGALKDAALAAGMKPEVIGDLAVIDTSDVTTDVIAGDGTIEVKISGVPEKIEALKLTRPWLFGTGKAPNINDNPSNSGAGGGQAIPKPGTVTGDALLKLEKESPALYKAYIGQMLKPAPAAG
jgi:hypothetical protein